MASNPAPLRTPPPTGSAKVRLYLEEEIREGRLRPGEQLPPVRTLARELEVSAATVFGIYKELARQGRVEGGVGRGTFLKAGEPRQRPAGRRLCFALNAPIGGRDLWTALFLEGVLKAASASSDRVSVLPLGGAAGDDDAVLEELKAELSQVDGLLFLPGRQMSRALYHQVSTLYEEAGKPVVCLNLPFPNALANFVAPDHFANAHRIARAWAAAGRKRLLYLASKNTRFTITNLLRPWGMQYALDQLRNDEDLSFSTLYAADHTEEAGFAAVEHLLGEGPPPDAIFTFGDWIALGAIRALEKNGFSVPRDTSVIGGSGLSLEGTLRPGMTRASQPMQQVAQEAIALLLRRIRLGGVSLPGVLLPVGIIPGDSTTAAENQLWEDSTIVIEQ